MRRRLTCRGAAFILAATALLGGCAVPPAGDPGQSGSIPATGPAVISKTGQPSAAVAPAPCLPPAMAVACAFRAMGEGRWRDARELVASVPVHAAAPDIESRRLVLVGMLADHDRGWAAADAAYSEAAAIPGAPVADVLNDHGMSLLARGQPQAARDLFEKALNVDPNLFAARNNASIAAALTGDFRLPAWHLLTDAQMAEVACNLGLIAERQNDLVTARRYLEIALKKMPGSYPRAADALARVNAS